jgi:hypothetical protein
VLTIDHTIEQQIKKEQHNKLQTINERKVGSIILIKTKNKQNVTLSELFQNKISNMIDDFQSTWGT